MASWYYKGPTTTPIQIPGRGSVVLTPKLRFEAPESSVAHLLKIGKVSRLRDPEPVTQQAYVPPALEVPQAPAAKEEVRVDSDPAGDSDVVGSEPSAESEEEADRTDDPVDPPAEEDKKPKSRKGRR